MASYRGDSDVFGVAVQIVFQQAPRAEQVNAYPAVNGKESLDMGSRGGMFVVKGLLIGGSGGDLSAAEALMRSYNDGRAGVLVDTFGESWPNCKMLAPEPQGRILQDGKYGYVRPYVVRLELLK